MSMTHDDKLKWMREWTERNGVTLELNGECGIGRECVGIIVSDLYPDYEWYDSNWDRIDPNGEVWTPPNAYHKHPCVAVLGRGEDAEDQLYEWLRWFDDNGFVLEMGKTPMDPRWEDPKWKDLGFLLGKGRYARMVRKT
jgi:hypothetical protein